MADEDDWKKLPVEEKVLHKVWKARVEGYEEAAKRFRMLDEKSSEFNNFLGIMKKFVLDSNAVAQEKGLDAVMSFVENAACATKCCEEVISGIVAKVLNGRPKTKQLGIDISLMYVELEKQDVVMEELIKGFSNKQPKIIAASIFTARTALSEFGGKVIKMKSLVQSIPKLLSHSDKAVREEAKQLAIEIYKWIRDAIKPQVQNIKPVQLKELEEEWAKLDATPPQPTRFTRSEQAKMAAAPPPPVAAVTAGGEVNSHVVAAPVAAVDPWEMFDPVEILSKLPADFYEKVESKKWQERKESLEALDKLTSNPRLEPGQYGEVCAVLKKIITKDSNINVVALAGKCVTGLAKGLRKKFSTYTSLLIPAIFGKFKEKKLNVVISLRDAIDACFHTTNLAAIMEDLIASLNDKNPSIKDETLKFLTRVFSESSPGTLTKGLLKQIVPVIISKMEDTNGPVRDSAAECLGTAMKLVGEKVMSPYVEALDKIKLEKVKEQFEKAEISAAGGAPAAPAASAPSKPAAKAAPAKAETKKPESKGPPAAKSESVPGKPKAVKAGGKPKAGGKKPGGKKPEKKKKKGNDFEADELEPTEAELPDGMVDAKAEELFGEERVKQMASNNWKERLEAVTEMSKVVEEKSSGTPAQVLVRILAKKPGWKDSNFQVMNEKFKMLAVIAKGNFSRRSAIYAISGLIEKIGDIKLKNQVKETLKVFAENISLNYISLKVANAAAEAKNPKQQTESLVWMTEAVREFGFRINLKPHVEFIKKELAHTNPGVRKAAIEFLATLHMYVGPNIRMFFEEEKPALLQQIDAEFAKVADQKPPAPTRRFKDDVDEEEAATAEDGGDEGGEDEGGAAVKMEDLVDRKDIGGQLTDELLAKTMDKNWKVRKEGLEEVQTIISTAKFITPDIGELPASLKARLNDNNKVLVTMAISISKQLAESGGGGMSRHKNTMLPAIIGTLSDAKPHLRKQGEEALDMWHSKIGFIPFLDNEILCTALKETNPNLKASLLGWLEKKLPNEKKLPAELKESIPPLFSCLEDRNPDVRKSAQACVPLFMAHVGFESMSKATGKLDPTSKTTVQGILEKARETVVPIATASKGGKGATSKSGNASKAASAAAAAAASAAAASAAAASAEEVSKEPPKKAVKKEEKTSKATSKKPAPAASKRGKAEPVDEGPPLIHKIGKADRAKDEKKLKVLKWNFTTPREESVDQLKEQMAPVVSGAIHTKLFHADFKYHIEAIGILTKAINEQQEAMTESLDLILKWVTLRFFDTNTSVLLKTLEFLKVLFSMLEGKEYHLTPLEHVSFMPYLLLKIGDPKDNVRKSVRELCKMIISVLPASKMFTYLMQGLESKNAKTRMECCDELGFLIEKFGMEVCQPSPKILKEIAAQISDRDNGVRSAALNCIVAAYNIIGEKVYKLIGRLNDKDMSYLEERIKRAGKSKPAELNKTLIVKPSAASERSKVPKMPSANDTIVKPSDKQQNAAPLPREPPIKREFELDLASIEGGWSGKFTAEEPQLKLVDFDAVEAAASIPQHLLEKYSKYTKTASSNQINTTTVKDPGAILDLAIATISSSDMQSAIESLIQMEDVFKKEKTNDALLKRIDQYLVTSIVQFKMLFSRHLDNKDNSQEDLERLLKLLLSGMNILFETKIYAIMVSKNVMKDLIYFFIQILTDKSLERFQDSELAVQCINRLILRMFANANKTNCVGACIKLLQVLSESNNTPPNVMKLGMKCVWKLIGLLPTMINEIDLKAILLDCHLFCKKLPPSVWRARNDRQPQQSIKMLLQRLIELKGNEVYDSLSCIDDPNESEVVVYVTKRTKKGKLTISNDENTRLEKKREIVNPPEPTDDMLVAIFKKIGSKENSRTGILELYNLKQKYPNYNVDPYFKGTTESFQNYIETTLKSIAAEKMAKQIDTSSDSVALSEKPPTTGDAAAYLERLNMIVSKYKSKANQAAEKPAVAKAKPEEPVLPEPDSDLQDVTIVPEVKLEEKKEKANIDLGDIKSRLEQIRQASASNSLR